MDNLTGSLQVNKGLGGFLKSLLWHPQARIGAIDGNDARSYMEAINAAKQDIDTVEMLFNSASDQDLIEYAIYQEHAARLKLSYLIKRAKEKGIRLTDYVPF